MRLTVILLRLQFIVFFVFVLTIYRLYFSSGLLGFLMKHAQYSTGKCNHQTLISGLTECPKNIKDWFSIATKANA